MSKQSMSRRDFLKVAGLTVAGTALASCGGKLPGGGGANPPVYNGEKVTLRFASWDSSTGADVYNSVIDLFKAANPNVTVNAEFTPQGYDDKLITSLSAGNAPDVFMWWNLPALTSKGAMEDLTPYYTGKSPLDMKQYYPAVFAMNKVGNMVVGTPDAFTPRAVFYNKKMFDDAKVPYPTNDWTWKDMVEMAKALTKGSGQDAQFGYYVYSDTYPIQGYLWSNGGDFISPDGKKASGYCDSPETIQALDWYCKLQTELHVAPTQTDFTTLGDSGAMFKAGKLAMLENGRWPQSEFKKTPGLDLGTVLPPKSPFTNKLVTVLHEASFCIAKSSQNKAAAWELCKWLGGEAGNTAFAKAGWGVPAMPSVVTALGMDKDPIEKTWVDAIPYGGYSCFMRTTVWDKAGPLFSDAIQSIFLGKATAAEAMKAVAPQVDAVLAAA
jgi:multiple sugar transport system substrate-binding protein